MENTAQLSVGHVWIKNIAREAYGRLSAKFSGDFQNICPKVS